MWSFRSGLEFPRLGKYVSWYGAMYNMVPATYSSMSSRDHHEQSHDEKNVRQNLHRTLLKYPELDTQVCINRLSWVGPLSDCASGRSSLQGAPSVHGFRLLP